MDVIVMTFQATVTRRRTAVTRRTSLRWDVRKITHEVSRIERRNPIAVKKLRPITTQAALERVTLPALFTLGIMARRTGTLRHPFDMWQMNKTGEQAHPLVGSATDPIDRHSAIRLIDRMTFRTATRRNR